MTQVLAGTVFPLPRDITFGFYPASIPQQWEGYEGEDTLAGVSREWDQASPATLDAESEDFSSSTASAESALQPQFSSAGIIKPDIVFFHEDLPEVFYNTIQRDIEVCGIGTLHVRPPASNPPSFTKLFGLDGIWTDKRDSFHAGC